MWGLEEGLKIEALDRTIMHVGKLSVLQVYFEGGMPGLGWRKGQGLVRWKC
jgi:hypothetical protein